MPLKPPNNPEDDPIYTFVADAIERLVDERYRVLIADVHREVRVGLDVEQSHELEVRIGWVARHRGYKRVKTSRPGSGGARWFYVKNLSPPEPKATGKLPPLPPPSNQLALNAEERWRTGKLISSLRRDAVPFEEIARQLDMTERRVWETLAFYYKNENAVFEPAG